MRSAGLALLALTMACRAGLPEPVLPLSATLRENLPEAPPAVVFAPARAPAVTAYVLANGLQLQVVQRPGAQSLALHYALRGAAEDGSLGPVGAARFSLDLATHPEAVGAALTGVLGSLQAYADENGGHVALSVATPALEQALKGLARLALTVELDADRIRSVAQAHLDVLGDSNYDTFELARRHAHRILYGEQHLLGQGPAEMFNTVTTLSMSELQRRHRQAFSPGSSALIVSGDVQPDVVRQLVEAHFGALAPEPAPQTSRASSPQAAPERRIRVLLLPGRYARLVLAFPAPAAASPERVSAELLNLLAADLFGSRLSRALRRRAGQTYGVDGTYKPRAEGGVWLIETVVDAQEIKTALEIVDAELARLREAPVALDELTLARTQLRERRRAQLADAGDAAALAAEAFLLSAPGAQLDLRTSWDQDYVALEQVSAAALQQFAARTLAERTRALVIAGDVSDFVDDWRPRAREFDLFIMESTKRRWQEAGARIHEPGATQPAPK